MTWAEFRCWLDEHRWAHDRVNETWICTRCRKRMPIYP